VVYRDAHAFREAMGPAAPGSWDGRDDASFAKALQEVLELGDADIQRLSQTLQSDSTWDNAVKTFWEKASLPPPTPKRRPLLHYYMADCKWATTATPGGYHFSVCLLRELMAADDFGWDMIVSVKPGERSRILTPSCPSWLRVVEIDAPRLYLDQLWSCFTSLKNRVDAVFYPKGWIPFFSPKRLQILAVLYDCMNDHYDEIYPGHIPRLKSQYFHFCTRNTLRRADHVFTISAYSRAELQRRYKANRVIQVIPLANSLPPGPILPHDQRKGLLCLGSRHPHKRTRETLELYQYWRKHSDSDETLFLTGPTDFPPDLLIGVQPLGRLSDDDLSRHMGSVRALLLLSDMEGFGLPMVEAYARHTPVLFRNAHSFQELMGSDAAGAWEGDGPESFARVLDDVLALSPDAITTQSEALGERYCWAHAAEAFLHGLKRLQQNIKMKT
jgi:glycosyltransferase involved in cell wall biosynthesis